MRNFLKPTVLIAAFAASIAATNVAHAVPSTTIVISEFRTRGPNGANDEFIELFNKSSSNVNIGGYVLRRSNASGTSSDIVKIPANTVMAPGGFYLIANTGSSGYAGPPTADLTYGTGITDDGGIALLNGSTIIDQVGMSTGSAYKEGTPLGALTGNTIQSYERKGGHCTPNVDTDNNSADFVKNAGASYPQNSTTVCAGDPCAGIVCNAPPGNCFQSTGTCSAGTCTYAPKSLGLACDDGNSCTTGEECDGTGVCLGIVDPCLTPPPATCTDPTHSRQFAPIGTCTNPGSCAYDETIVECEFGCNGATGQCALVSCDEVTCDTPPNTQCYDAVGTCSFGVCEYALKAAGTACTDNNACTNGDICDSAGTCLSGTPTVTDDNNPCTLDSCNTLTGAVSNIPIENGTSCDDGNLCNGVATCQEGACLNGPVVVCETPSSDCFDDTGACIPSTGLCVYQPKTQGTACSDGNACTTSDVCDGNGLCAGGTKECPVPTPVCDNGSSRVFSNGSCQQNDGSCTFDSTLVTCAQGCDETWGLCVGDPCIGVVCDAAPSTSCGTGAGFCASGTCIYPVKPEGSSCDDGDACTTNDKCSAAGACAGTALACNTPTAPACVDSNTSHQTSPIGTCSSGSCNYMSETISCAQGCDANTGLCAGDACTGINCDEPPSPCFKNIGTCENATCSYTPKATGDACDDSDPCTEQSVCQADGTCSGTPKVCNTPPPPSCANENASRTFAAVGQCNAEEGCTYTETEKECAEGCDVASGLCVDDPCIGVVCNTPSSACFNAIGQCSEGTCTYFPKAAGTACDDGDACTVGDSCGTDGACEPGPVNAEDESCAGSGGSAGTAGTGGSAGSAGSAGTSGSAGSAGSAGNAGEAGNAGTGGSAGEAGNAGSAGTGGTVGGSGGAGGFVGTDELSGGGLSCAVSNAGENTSTRASWLALIGLGWLVSRRRKRAA